MLTLILLNPQIYQAPESVITNHMIHYFHDLGQCYIYWIKAITLITADHLQWNIYVKKKPCLCVHKKKLAQNFPGLLIPHQVNGNIYLSYLYFTHSPLSRSVTQIQQQLSRVNISADFLMYINRFRLPRSQGFRS